MANPRYICDNCKADDEWPSAYEIRGYYPRKASGILLPESARGFHFCSHDCIVTWMRWAVSKED